MRVLVVHDWVRIEGGAESYVRWLRPAVSAAGDDVRLLTSSAGTAAGGTAEYVARGSERGAAQALLQIGNPFAVAAMRDALRRFRPEVVLAVMFEMHLSPAALLAARGIPLVLNIVNYKPFCPTGLKLLPSGALCDVRAGAVCYRAGCVGAAHWLRDRPRYALIRACLERAAAVLTCSEWMRGQLEREGITATVLRPPAFPPGPTFVRRPTQEPSFVYVGRLAREKGVSLLLRSFAALRARHPAARLSVVGDGPERTALQGLARELGGEQAVTFRGFVQPDSMDVELAEAWALVAPSLWAEPFGIVALEAIARGVPVIASAAGGLVETIEAGRSGLLFPPGDGDGLLRCLEEIADRRAFPGLALDQAVIERTMRAQDPDEHVAALRATLATAIRRGARPAAA